MKLTQRAILGYSVLYEGLRVISANGGQMRRRDLIEKLKDKYVPGNLSKNWKDYLTWNAIDANKAGFLVTDSGLWSLTSQGEQAVKLPLEEFASRCKQGYKKWKENHTSIPLLSKEDIKSPVIINLEEIEAQADDGIRDFIYKQNPYEFQETVAALLRAMGYNTPYIAPKGKDGGVDIIGYPDPLGTGTPRIKVQVKHYPNGVVGSPVIQQLSGALAERDEVGIVATSGTFSPDAKKESAHGHIMIRLLDIGDLILLWIRFYRNMPQEDKARLPIKPIYFVNPSMEH